MSATMHKFPSVATTLDPDHILSQLRASGVTEVDELLVHWAQRQELPAEEAAQSQPEFERSLRECTMALERALHVQDIERLAPTAQGVVLEDERYLALAPSNLSILLMSGWVKVSRPLFRARGGHGGATVDVLAARIGLVAESTSLAAARLLAKHSVSLSQTEVAETVAESGGMKPSASHVGRVMKSLGATVEAHRSDLEESIRVAELVEHQLPARDKVASIAWSLDGIMVRMKDAPNTPGATKQDAVPKGHREAASATIALYDAAGKRLHTISMAQMPESKKVTLTSQLQAELRNVVARYPEAQLLAIADAAKENWRIIDQIEGALGITSERAVDYFHARDHLLAGLKQTGARKSKIKHWAHRLLHEQGGADACLAELTRRRLFTRVANCPERTKKLEAEITYFNNNASQMKYPTLRAKHLPIGTGVQEAACKSLIGARLKRSGMSWLRDGGQAILTFRAFDKSGRYDAAWTLLEPLFRKPYQRLNIDQNNKRKKPTWSQQRAA